MSTATATNPIGTVELKGYSKPCRDCGTRILIVRQLVGRKRFIPLDCDPDPMGWIGFDENGYAVSLTVAHPGYCGELYRPHFETCPAVKHPAPPPRRDLE